MAKKGEPWGKGEDIDFEKSKKPYGEGSGRPVSKKQIFSPLDIAKFLNSFMPVTGDIQSGAEAIESFKDKEYLGAALGALGALPFIPNTAKFVGKGVAKQIEEGTGIAKYLMDPKMYAVEDSYRKGIPYSGMSSIDEFLKNTDIPFMTVPIDKKIIGEGLDPYRAWEIRNKVENVAQGDNPRLFFHAGDAGIGSDTVAKHMSGDRGTGHFGTGTYAVTDLENLTPFYTETRPVIGLISRPEAKFFTGDNDKLDKAHRALREINYLADQKNLIPKDKVLEGIENFDKYWQLKQTNPELAEVIEIVKKIRFDAPSKKMYTDVPESILDAVNQHIKSRMGGGGTFWRDRIPKDSASTRFMKNEGYEGVNTRLAPELDNTQYGSVIYRKGNY